MKVRIVGAHQCEAVDRHFTTILVDGVLAIDAGSLASGLTLADQLKVRDVLITHQHWDHVKDLAGFGFNLLRTNARATVYCSEQVRQVVSSHLLASCYWIDFFAGPDPNQPVFEQQKVDPGTQVSIGSYCVLSVPVNHSVPTMGFQITDQTGRKLYYTGDNGPGCGQFWSATQPDTIITECTYPNEQAEAAERHGHLAPVHLEQALKVFRTARGYVPRVILVHVNPLQEEIIRSQVADVGRRLQATVEIGIEGMIVTV